MVQKELESQATQLIEHCQYGLEQVEAEKLLLVAGKFLLPDFSLIFIVSKFQVKLSGCVISSPTSLFFHPCTYKINVDEQCCILQAACGLG